MAKLSNAALNLIAASMLIALLYYGRAVLAPVAFALFIIMLVWQVQRALASALHPALTLLLSFVLVLGVLLSFGWLMAWTVGQVGRRIASDATTYQFLYQQFRAWLEAHGIAASLLWSDNFNITTTLRMLQTVSLQLRNLFSFWLIALVYVLLGLAELDEFRARINRLNNQQAVASFLRASKAAAAKIRFYMLLRTAMSLATGAFVWLLTRLLGVCCLHPQLYSVSRSFDRHTSHHSLRLYSMGRLAMGPLHLRWLECHSVHHRQCDRTTLDRTNACLVAACDPVLGVRLGRNLGRVRCLHRGSRYHCHSHLLRPP
jgi:predicted PurR-regulated permease PerM